MNPELLHTMDTYWSAANYLLIDHTYLNDNPLLKRPLTLAEMKHMLAETVARPPVQNFIYMHLNRIINQTYSNPPPKMPC